MKVVHVREYGRPEVLRIEEAAAPRPAAGEVVVAVEVAGVSYGDTIARSGRYPFPLPYVPGLEVAAAGRIGSLLVQLAKTAGATVIGAAGGTAKLTAASGFGADVTVDYSQPRWVAEVKSATGGRGVDVVLDATGGTTGEQALETAVTGSGRIAVYGYTSGTWATIDTRQLVRRGLTVTGALGIALAKPHAEQRADAEQALQAARTGHLVPHIHATYPLAHAAQAHADLEQRRATGTLLLRP